MTAEDVRVTRRVNERGMQFWRNQKIRKRDCIVQIARSQPKRGIGTINTDIS
jgi:hypothetical protein